MMVQDMVEAEADVVVMVMEQVMVAVIMVDVEVVASLAGVTILLENPA